MDSIESRIETLDASTGDRQSGRAMAIRVPNKRSASV